MQQEVAERTAGTARALRKWLHSMLLQCLQGWAAETRRVRDERDAILRAQLMRRGASLQARALKGPSQEPLGCSTHPGGEPKL